MTQNTIQSKVFCVPLQRNMYILIHQKAYFPYMPIIWNKRKKTLIWTRNLERL